MLRDFCGYSQKEMADFLNISQPAYFKIESGNHKITLLHLDSFAEALGLSTNDILTFAFEELKNMAISRTAP